MLCRFVEKNLSAYLDGETGRLVSHLLERHLKTCADCKAKYETLKTVAGLVKLEKEKVSLSPEFMANLRLKIAEQRVRTSEKKNFIGGKLAFSALGLLVLLAGGVLLFPRGAGSLPKETNEYATISFQTKAEVLYTDSGVEMATFNNQTRR